MIKKLLFSLFFSCSIINADPLLVVVLMVKNEESVINATLEPFVRAKVDSYLILDTGSTDKTIETVEKYFKDNNIKQGYVCQEPFVNFAVSRNKSIEFAKQKFPDAKFFLLIDAEWYVENVQGLINFCKEHANDFPQIYLLRLFDVDNSVDFYASRLMNAKSNAVFKGVVHETLNGSICNKYVPSDIFVKWKPSNKGMEKTHKRWYRDKDLLANEVKRYEGEQTSKQLESNPDYIRNLFYLAQTHSCLGETEEAYNLYIKRSKFKGFNLEEDYETFYRLGNTADILCRIKPDKYNWHMAFDHYMKAYQLRPHRAEPLMRIAAHYWPEYPNKPDSNIPAAYLFARRAYDLEYPVNDHLFVDKGVYDYERFDMLSKCAGHVGDHKMGEEATLKAIKAKLPHLYNNLTIYQNETRKK